ncbi:MAG TPA: hypothetical protein PKI14_11065 [Fervidobacterium sp.]|jgi:hypothetical protein|nr:hypothetical protein [Fervidobacterium sp.]
MYEEYLGENYHDAIRKSLGADEELCPNSMIDAPINIEAMKSMLSPAILKLRGKVDSEPKFALLSKIARYYLAGILCVAIQSRIKVPPFNVPKYTRKDWAKKQRKCIEKANNDLMRLLRWE